MTKPQVILDEGGNPAFAVIPWREYERLATASAEASLSDEELYDRAVVEAEESFPIAVADRLLAGEKRCQGLSWLSGNNPETTG